MDMPECTERFTIQVSDRGLEIRGRDGSGVTLSPSEALMLLDILKDEASELARLADEASPLPMRIRRGGD